MMLLLDRLLDKLGLRRLERRRFTLDGQLIAYLQELADHEQRTASEVAGELLASGAAQRDQAQEIYQRWRSLSIREQEVAALICLGCTNRQIGNQLVISLHTAKTHVRNILYKFDLHSKEELRMLLADWDFSAWF
jgi:DNA-binding CsgD family transcriptional regulator